MSGWLAENIGDFVFVFARAVGFTCLLPCGSWPAAGARKVGLALALALLYYGYLPSRPEIELSALPWEFVTGLIVSFIIGKCHN